VFNLNYDRFTEILVQAINNRNCDSRSVLRNILYRAAEEANYLSFQFDGDDRADLKQARIHLEGVIADLPLMLDDGRNVLHRHRATISDALTLAGYLIAIDRAQTASHLNWLEAVFGGCPCGGCQCQNLIELG
jgi:hypothetical protein